MTEHYIYETVPNLTYFPLFFVTSLLLSIFTINSLKGNAPAIQYGDVQYGQKPHTGNFVTLDPTNPANSYLQQSGPSSQVCMYVLGGRGA